MSLEDQQPAPNAGECLDEEDVLALVEGRLDDDQREAVQSHVDTCDSCRVLVAKTAEALLPTGDAGFEQPPAPLTRLAQGERVGRYVIQRCIGAGAMGVVYEAQDTELDRRVALKLLRTAADMSPSKQHARLMREARAASRVAHRNVVPVHDVFTLPDGPPVLVMDLLHGRSLRDELDDVGTLSVAATLDIAEQIVDALIAAHAQGVIHRDLKPDNVFLVETADDASDAESRVKVLDFGVAKLVDPEPTASAGLTGTGAVVGTPYYMAPEQAFAEPEMDARVDLWALGVILFESVSGNRPIEAANVGQVLKALAHLNVRRLSDATPDAPPAFAALVDDLLAGKDERIATAREVKDRLRAVRAELAATPSTARRSIASTPFAKVAAIVAAVGVVALAASRFRSTAPPAEPTVAAETETGNIEFKPAAQRQRDDAAKPLKAQQTASANPQQNTEFKPAAQRQPGDAAKPLKAQQTAPRTRSGPRLTTSSPPASKPPPKPSAATQPKLLSKPLY